MYSRITGYYRPVQNWNTGKAQEFKERKNYDVSAAIPSDRNKVHIEVVTKQQESKQITDDNKETVKYLFTTKTCPNCAKAREMLKAAGEEYTLVDAQENLELVTKYGIMQAPTLVVTDGEAPVKYVNASNIQKYVNRTKA